MFQFGVVLRQQRSPVLGSFALGVVLFVNSQSVWIDFKSDDHMCLYLLYLWHQHLHAWMWK